MMKKGFLLGGIMLGVCLALFYPHLAFAADAFSKAETSLQNTGMSFQRALKWVGVSAFLFGAAQYTVGRKQQGKFFMTSAAAGYALVLAVFIIFSLIEGVFGGLR
ncbi:MAG: hypothetical protein ACYCVD_04360 [Desulfitobacteriaceae bacterium]